MQRAWLQALATTFEYASAKDVKLFVNNCCSKSGPDGSRGGILDEETLSCVQMIVEDCWH